VNFRVLFIVATVSFAVAASSAWAQQANNIPIVAYLSSTADTNDPLVEAWRQGLREQGYVDGQNLRFEFRTALGHFNRLPGLAEELVKLKVDVIVVGTGIAAQAARHATSTIPIVTAVLDPISSGLVTNLAHPGGNVTGLSGMSNALLAKRLQLVKESIPRIKRVAVLWKPDNYPSEKIREEIRENLEAAAGSLSIELKFVAARTPEEFDPAFSAVSQMHAQALYLVESPLFYVYRITLAELALKARLPTISAARNYTDVGTLISYGANYSDQLRRSAVYVDKILKGAKPGDLPIEQPTKFELVVNLRTAKTLKITIPQSILLQADEVIR
jgi:putative ABC transport system substrate-binding protein